MPATLSALWATPPLTTDAAMIERSAQAGRMVNLIRANRDEWPDLSDAERRTAASRLQFARWRTNANDRLRARVVREGPEMRVRAEVEGTAVAVLAFAVMLCHLAARWVSRRLP